jgi:hypothetical protein
MERKKCVALQERVGALKGTAERSRRTALSK